MNALGAIGMERLAYAIDRALVTLGLHEAAERHRALVVWDEVVGPDLARHARAVAVRGNILEVAVRDSAWANQVAFLKSELLERLNLRLGQAHLNDLRVRVGPLPPRPSVFGEDTLEPDEIRQAEAEAAAEFANIAPEDERLRSAFIGLVARARARAARRARRPRA